MINVERKYPQLYLTQLMLRITNADVYSLEDLNQVYQKLFPQNEKIIKILDIVVKDLGIKHPEKVRELIAMLKKEHNAESFELTL